MRETLIFRGRDYRMFEFLLFLARATNESSKEGLRSISLLTAVDGEVKITHKCPVFSVPLFVLG